MVKPRVIAASKRAMLKAERLLPHTPMWIEYPGKKWGLASPSSGEEYVVFLFAYTRGDDPPWWEKYGCTCAAAEAGLACCWHKAAIHRWRTDG